MKDQLVQQSTSIRNVMQQLEAASTKIVVVVDAAGHVIRTLTDGDLRRGLLQGATMDAPVDDLAAPPAPPVTALVGSSDQDISDLFARTQVNSIVLVDEAGQPVGIEEAAHVHDRILLSPPHLGDAEAGFVEKSFADNWIAPAGPNIDAFEVALAQEGGRTHALALSSGTAGLHLALRVLEIQPQDRIYVSDLTFVASLQPILYEHAQPVLIDSEPDTWNMSPQALASRLEKDAKLGQLPAAIVVVHLYGQSAKLDEICALAQTYDIPVIEDAAESLGAQYRGRPSGAHGLLSVYSFNGNKIITTSGGGALVSDDTGLIDKARKLSTQGRDAAEHYQHSEVAYNYRMSNVLAGIGRGQLAVLGDRVARRREIYEIYKAGFQSLQGVSFQADAPGSVGSRWLTVLRFDPDQVDVHPYQIMRHLGRLGIETRPAWKPMSMQPLCAGYEFEPHSPTEPVSGKLFMQSLCLPSGSAMSRSSQDRIINAICDIISGA
ncbi:aminotransferase class I/II-fold pyridoxal phosphate-dependent enzyme [Falsiruegeria litorea]|nr:aminotransferase class I/II-fold pyridoxal phosphate-dependent enzyme [Falsiruegeria litorea]